MSLYDDLGVGADATTEEINAAYRKQAKRHHPDAGGDADTFARLGRAVAVLRDPTRRAEYDRTGDADAASRPDDPDGTAREFLMQSFGAAMQSFLGGASDDVIGMARRDLRSKRDTQSRDRRNAELTARSFASAKGKLTFKGAGDDILGKVLNAKAEELTRIIESMKENEAAIARALELLDQWEWQRDQPAGRAYAPQWFFTTNPSDPSSVWPDHA